MEKSINDDSDQRFMTYVFPNWFVIPCSSFQTRAIFLNLPTHFQGGARECWRCPMAAGS